MPVAFFLYSYLVLLQLFNAFSCSAAGIIIILPFIAIPSMIAISCLNDQYGCRCLCTSALIDSQLWSMNSDSMPMCLLSIIANLISSAIMQSGMSVHDSIDLIVIQMPGIAVAYLA